MYESEETSAVNDVANGIAFYLPPRGQPKTAKFGLTAFELEVLRNLADGYRLKELAGGHRTEKHMYNLGMFIRIKMGARTTEHAIAIAFREGLVK